MKSPVYVIAGILTVMAVLMFLPNAAFAQGTLEPGETLWPTSRAQRGRSQPDFISRDGAPPPPVATITRPREQAVSPPEAAIEPQAGTENGDLSDLPETGEDLDSVAPAGRRAVITGRITDVDPREITVLHLGREITVRADTLVAGGGNLSRYYDEDMWVTVEGTLEREDEILATSIAQGDYLD